MSPKLLLLAAALFLPQLARADLLIKDGQKVAFIGDSITANGWNFPGGYVHLVVSGLATLGVHITPIPAGAGGNTSRDMLGRLDRDVIQKHPDWMTLSCGVNDVWRHGNGVPLEEYKKNVTSILDQCKAAKINVLVMTPTVIQEQDNDDNRKLAGYIDWLRTTAKEHGLPLAEENAAFWTVIKAVPREPWQGHRVLTGDGVHPNPDGNELIAHEILRTIGATDAQLSKVEAAWQNEPSSAYLDYRTEFAIGPMTLAQWKKIKALADAHGHAPFPDYAMKFYFDALREAFVAHANDQPPASRRDIEADAQARFGKMIDALPNP